MSIQSRLKKVVYDAVYAAVNAALTEHPPEHPDDRLSVAEAAERMRVSTRTVRRYIAEGKLEAIVEGRIFITKGAIWRFNRKASGKGVDTDKLKQRIGMK